jgi:hypothetical protein
MDIPFGGGGNSLTSKALGVAAIPGDTPEIVPIAVRFLLTVLTCAALASFAFFLMSRRGTRTNVDRATSTGCLSYPYVSNESLIVLLAPFTVAYVLLVVTRVTIFDRYFLPLLFVGALGLIRLYTQAISDRLPRLCFVFAFLYAAYALANTHDMFAFQRARVTAATEITATGIPRTSLEAGFEYDAWTQLEQSGYVNEPKIVNPSDAYHAWVPPNVPPACLGWFRSYAPSVHPLLHLFNAPDNCYEPSRFPPVVYETWLPPRQRAIYILESH